MGKKPSFLERLTGVLEDEEKEVRMTNNAPTEENDEEEEKEKELEEMKERPLTIEPENAKTKKIKKEPIIAEPSKEKNFDWLPEAEGQLTIDVYQTPSDIVIKSTIAGVNPDDLDISITNDMVTIKGKREKDTEVTEGDYYYQECYWGSFSRSIILPVDVEAERAEASLKNGILSIRLPKIEKVKTRKIRVSA